MHQNVIDEDIFQQLIGQNCLGVTLMQIKETGLLSTIPDIETDFILGNDSFHLHIQQSGLRVVSLSSANPLPFKKFWSTLSEIETLFMLYDGYFLQIASFEIIEPTSSENISKFKEELLHRRLVSFNSADFCYLTPAKLIELSPNTVNSNIIKRWHVIKLSLDIVHPIVLLCMADTGLPVDCKLAQLVEIFESLAAFVYKQEKKQKHIFHSFKKINKDASLKLCLDEIIFNFGKGIFNNSEYSFIENHRQQYKINDEKHSSPDNENDPFLTQLVNSRIRIMHTKRNFQEKTFSGVDAVYYLSKLSFLYRRIILEYLEIEYSTYSSSLCTRMQELDVWRESALKEYEKMYNK